MLSAVADRALHEIHAFGPDVLADHDGIALAELIRSGDLTRAEVIDAAVARAERVEGALDAIALLDARRAVAATSRPVSGPFSGVPTFVKDNVDVSGWPTNHGSEAFTAKPATHDARVARLLLGTGLVPLGKSRMPEFGFNASTEFMTGQPTCNPWDTRFSAGASSGGAGALVAAGVVPVAHANDGGGSIRIPAAACGLVGLKPTRGRFPPAPLDRLFPVQIGVEGVLSRSVRDTAHFMAATEQALGRRRSGLPPVGLVEGPGSRRLRIGLVLQSVADIRTDDETRRAVTRTAEVLAGLGHEVVDMPTPVDAQFAADFQLYWGLLGYVASHAARLIAPEFEASRLDGLTLGLSRYFRARVRNAPAAVTRLRAAQHRYAQALAGYDGVLSPVTAHTTPRLGHLSPRQPFDQLFERLINYVAFTPLANAAGSPAISLPLGATSDGLPIGVQLMAGHGDERSLLELAYELEAAVPFRRLGA
jgi:amidase